MKVSNLDTKTNTNLDMKVINDQKHEQKDDQIHVQSQCIGCGLCCPISINNKEKDNSNHYKITLELPQGTKFCPESRAQNGIYYMVLYEAVKIEIDTTITTMLPVMINGARCNVINPNNFDKDKYALPEHRIQHLLRSFNILPKTQYFIVDPLIDPLGINREFIHAQTVVCEPNTVAYILPEIINDNKSLNNKDYKTNCEIIINDPNWNFMNPNMNVQQKPDDAYFTVTKKTKCII